MALAATWVWIALAQPLGAHAFSSEVAGLPAMCADNATSFVLPTQLVRGADRLLERVSDKAAEPAHAQDDSPVAWCLAPDDPRCSPRDAGSLPDATRMTPALRTDAFVAPAQRVGARVAKPRPAPLGAARAGEHGRLERPPRRQSRR
jgi:hypothetical protein